MQKTASVTVSLTPSDRVEFTIDGPVLTGDGPDRFFMTAEDAVALCERLTALVKEARKDSPQQGWSHEGGPYP